MATPSPVALVVKVSGCVRNCSPSDAVAEAVKVAHAGVGVADAELVADVEEDVISIDDVIEGISEEEEEEEDVISIEEVEEDNSEDVEDELISIEEVDEGSSEEMEEIVSDDVEDDTSNEEVEDGISENADVEEIS